MKNFLIRLFGLTQKTQAPRGAGKSVARTVAKPTAKPVVAFQLPPLRQTKAPAHYKKGDVIGDRYDIYGIVGKGGLGVVYLAQCRDPNNVCALKTFRDELLASPTARAAFKKEALLWVNLDEHPFILAARFVSEFSGRLFVQMDFIAPDEKRRASLADHLALTNGPLEIDQLLKWSVQFCLGMEHAHAHGIVCHRDIKPANILIRRDGTLKIGDFGLATAAEVAWQKTEGQNASLITGDPQDGFCFSLLQTGAKTRCGTPGYMAPEVYRGEGADIRSDIYSFGLVLWQMTSGSRIPPFATQYRGNLEHLMREIYEQQMTGHLPRTDERLDPIIQRCLDPQPAQRWGGFQELRGALEPILERITGQKVEIPKRVYKEAEVLTNKGGSLNSLGKYEEAITCLDRALAIDPQMAPAWGNKGCSLASLGRRDEALRCFDQALAINPLDAIVLFNKGLSLAVLGRRKEAIECYDQSLAIDTRFVKAWSSKGNELNKLGRKNEGLYCYNQALAINPLDAVSWNNKGATLAALHRREEAIECYDKSLTINPRFAQAWVNKGNSLTALGRRKEANHCFAEAKAIDPKK